MATLSEVLLPQILDLVRERFKKARDSVTRKSELSLVDCLMSGLAIFLLKFPSLLQFDKQYNEEQRLRHNLNRITDIPITVENIYQLMRGGRARHRSKLSLWAKVVKARINSIVKAQENSRDKY